MMHVKLCALVAGALWAGACLAAEPSLCKSLCDTDKRACRTRVRTLAEENGGPFLAMREKNPLAVGAQGQVPTEASRAIDNAGTQARRMGHAGECDDTYLRCTRACAAPDATSVVKPAAGRREAAARAGEG